MRDTQRSRDRKIGRGREAPQWDADVGLDPGIPKTHLELKADAQLLSHQVTPGFGFKSCVSNISIGPPAFFS